MACGCRRLSALVVTGKVTAAPCKSGAFPVDRMTDAFDMLCYEGATAGPGADPELTRLCSSASMMCDHV
jgi:hypothetical protein